MAGAPGARAGGIAGLVAFLREHGGAIEADLRRYYGIPLSGITDGRLTWRHLGVLIGHLPRHSALVREVHGERAEWSTSDHLLALTVDALQIANWQRSTDGSKGRNRPKPIPRPGIRSGSRLGNAGKRTPAEARAYLARFRPAEEVPDGL